MTTITPDYTPGQAAALAAVFAPRTMALLSLSVPRQSLRRVQAELAKNPKGGPRYLNRNQDAEFRFSYCFAEVGAGILMVMAELNDATGDAAILDLVRDAEVECRRIGRLDHFDRAHDLTEFAGTIGSAAGWVSGIRKARHEREEARRYGGEVESLTYLRAYYGPPQWQIQHLVRTVIRRWLPAMQNIISRLPPGERQAAADAAQLRLRDHLLSLSKLHTMTRKASDEHKRWEFGFGAVDAAIIEGAAMVGYAKEVADRMEDDGTDLGHWADHIRSRAGAAWKSAVEALDELAVKRFDVMKVRVWQYNKADMVRFAHATGGIGPELEVLYHAKGSRMLGY